jgi:hypothetical protein
MNRRFLTTISVFSSSMVLASLYKSQSLLLRALRRVGEADGAAEKANELQVSWPSIGKWMHFCRSPATVLLDGSTNSPEDKPEDEDADEPFLWPWRRAIGDHVKVMEVAIKFLWEWSLDDVAADHLPIGDSKKTMKLPHAMLRLLVMSVHREQQM